MNSLSIFSATILTVTCFRLAFADCGRPGNSRRSFPSKTEENGVYAEGYEMEYSCDYIPIGGHIRKCKAGRWSKPIPKCPEILNVTGLKVRGGSDRSIYVTWAKKEKVAALQLAIRRPSHLEHWPGILVTAADDMGAIEVTIDEGTDEDIQFIKVTSSSTDVKSYRKANRIVLKTNTTFSKCEANAQGQIVSINGSRVKGEYLCLADDSHELYYLDNMVDDCEMPDTPLHSDVSSTFASGIYLNSSYICHDGYKLKSKQIRHSPACPKNGDWTSYDYKPCEAVTCDKDHFKYQVTYVNQPLIDGRYVPVGAKGYLICSTADNHRYLLCNDIGEWVPQTKLCSRGENGDADQDGLIIICLIVVLIAIVVFGGFMLYRRSHDNLSRNRHRDVNFKAKEMGSDANIAGASMRYVANPQDTDMGNYEAIGDPNYADGYTVPSGPEAYYVQPCSRR